MPKAFISILVASVLLLPVVVHGATGKRIRSHNENYWRARIAKVHRGMKRARVEKILPVHSEDHEKTEGMAYLSVYAIDPEWVVEVPYDFHGFDPDPKRNPNLLLHLYDNRVAGRIRLIHQHTNID